MAINGIPGTFNSYGSYRATSTISAPKVKASEEGLFKPITAKVSGALSDEYVEQIKACARKAAADGTNMVSSGYASMRDAQMGKHVSPDRGRAISQVSAMFKNPNLVLHPGENLFDLLSIPFTATINRGAMFGTTAEIYSQNGEMIAGYRDGGGWTSVPTADESRFQYESNQIYREAYNAAKAEIAAAKQTTAPAANGDAPASFDIKA
jgi:hypothetical protein